jgi:hypothetical protein
MRYLRIVLTLVFGLVMAGPEAHACPVHDGTPAAAHHHTSGQHKQNAHCTCPQACCPVNVAVAIPATAPSWTAAPLPVVAIDLEVMQLHVLPSRARLLPFALAPPLL